MRLFFALPAPTELRADLARLLAVVALPGRPAPPEQWHVTLAFAPAWRPAAASAGQACEGMLAELVAACARLPATLDPVAVTGFGAFPTARAARVVWLGFDAAPLQALAGATGVLLGDVSGQRFRAHLTLTRLPSPAPAGVTLDALAAGRVPAVVAFKELVLFRSHLSAHGARHEPLWRAPVR